MISFLHYGLVLLVLLFTFICGFILARLTPEELPSLKIYLRMLSSIFFAAGIFLTFRLYSLIFASIVAVILGILFFIFFLRPLNILFYVADGILLAVASRFDVLPYPAIALCIAMTVHSTAVYSFSKKFFWKKTFMNGALFVFFALLAFYIGGIV
ncbi:MAG: hypothetical protein WC916_05635 [Candidatus Woesearchaeota archaeon]